MLKQKLQYFGHLKWRANSLEKTVMVGKIEGRRRGNRAWDGWMASPIQWTWVWADSGNSEGQGNLACCSPRGGRVGHNWVTEQHHYSVCVCVCVCARPCSVMSDSLWPPWTVAHQVPLSIELSRKEHWSGLPFPSPGDLPDPGIEPASPVSLALVAGFFTTEPTEKVLSAKYLLKYIYIFTYVYIWLC